MPLDPQAREFLEALLAANVPPVFLLTPEQARQRMLLLSNFGPQPELDEVRNLTIDGPAGSGPLGIRVYRPFGFRHLPAVVYCHGGGWVTGSVETHDGLCRWLASSLERVIVSVDYRLAPEHKYPTPLDDVQAALQWTVRNFEDLGSAPGPVVIAGDSAGGNLAAALALRDRDRIRSGAAERKIGLQILLYPVLDHELSTASMREYAEGYLLTRDAMACFWRHYLPDAATGTQPEASPLKCPDLTDVAPAVLLTAGFDPLRDEGAAYAARLEAAGVRVRLLDYPDQIHDFLRRTHLFDQARAAFADIRDAVADIAPHA